MCRWTNLKLSLFCRSRYCRHRPCLSSLLGSLRNDDGDGNENGKKAIGLDKQNNNFASATPFFVHFSTVVARLQRETAKLYVLSRTGTKDNNFL